MRKTTTAVLGLLLPLALLACGETGTQQDGQMGQTSDDAMASDTMPEEDGEAGATIALAARGGSGISGEARVTPAGDSVRIALSLTGLEQGQSYAAHVHTGTCSAGGGVDQPLSAVDGQADGTGGSTTVLAGSVLADTTHFVQAHGSGGTPVACGDLPAPSAWQADGGMSGSGESEMSGEGSGG